MQAGLMPDATDGQGPGSSETVDGQVWHRGTDLPVTADPWGRRLLAAVAESAYQRTRARNLRAAARALRAQALALRRELSYLETFSGRMAAPEDDERLDPARAVEEGASCGGAVSLPAPAGGPPLREWAARARAAAMDSRWESAAVRSLCGCEREQRRHNAGLIALFHRSEYRLPPLEQRGPDIDVDETEPADEAGTLTGYIVLDEQASGSSILYFWGYAPLVHPPFGEPGEAMVAAAAFAAAAGWDASRPGSWAREISAPWGLPEVLRRFRPQLRQEPAIAGWGIRRQWHAG